MLSSAFQFVLKSIFKALDTNNFHLDDICTCADIYNYACLLIYAQLVS